MKAMAMVAHPDDCIIFAYSFMQAFNKLDWTICYLTYEANDYRGSELKRFWDRRQIKIKFLGYVDDWHDIKNKKISFNEETACMDIHSAIADQEIILTHNEDGDYGHLHHIFVNQATSNHPRRVTFAGPGKGTDRFVLKPNSYTFAELPEHRKVIEGFHSNGHSNEYVIPDTVKVLLTLTDLK
jgi:LmbE family N-acetylglucosaminyl deacetylase